jgi:hypothetical protein
MVSMTEPPPLQGESWTDTDGADASRASGVVFLVFILVVAFVVPSKANVIVDDNYKPDYGK